MISLVLTTFEREEHFELFLNSLKNNLENTFKLIVLDQNDLENDSCLNSLKINLPESHYQYKRVKRMSLSSARNIGVELIGEKSIIGFPDDDCIYPPGLLQLVDDYYDNNDGVLVFNSTSIKESSSVFFEKVKLSYDSVVGGIISYTLFFDFRKSEKELFFDENLGVGTDFGSSEESDFTINYLNSINSNFIKIPQIEIFHPDKESTLNKHREINYAKGTGGFLRKNIKIIYRKSPLLIVRIFFGPILHIFYGFLLFDRARVSRGYLRLIYRYKGYFSWN